MSLKCLLWVINALDWCEGSLHTLYVFDWCLIGILWVKSVLIWCEWSLSTLYVFDWCLNSLLGNLKASHWRVGIFHRRIGSLHRSLGARQ